MGATLEASTSGKKRQQPEPDINVTPLVDVCLVLLIIMMVIAPALEHGEPVDLPSVLTIDAKGKTDPLTVTLGGSGRLYFEKQLVDEERLKALLVDAHARTPDRKVILKGDGKLPYEKVRNLFALIQDQGFPGVALVVSKKKGADDKEEADPS